MFFLSSDNLYFWVISVHDDDYAGIVSDKISYINTIKTAFIARCNGNVKNVTFDYILHTKRYGYCRIIYGEGLYNDNVKPTNANNLKSTMAQWLNNEAIYSIA